MLSTDLHLSPRAITRLALAAGLTVALLLAGAVAMSTDAEAALKYKQPGCGKLQQKVNNSTGAKKRAAKAKLKQCKANATVYRQVRNSRFVGERADGVEIDNIYCGNGKWQDDVADGGDVGKSGWRIVGAKVKKGNRNFTAIIEAWIPGGKHVQGIIRSGDTWQIGWEFAGKINDPGTVTKTNASAACASL